MDRKIKFSSTEVDYKNTGGITNETAEKIKIPIIDNNVGIKNCWGQVSKICGNEAACYGSVNSSICVCPHDFSLPTSDLQCPHRRAVSISPNRIKPIILPNIGTTLNNSNITNNKTTRQIERVRLTLPEIISILLGCFFLILVLGIIIYGFKKRYENKKNKSKNSLDKIPMSLQNSLLLSNKYTPNPLYLTSTTLDVAILRRENLEIFEVIGQGAFGKVYKGKLENDCSEETVAIKILNDFASREDEEDFTREVDIMSTFHHENILSLKGVVLRNDEQSPCMVFEYMPYGDLAGVLRANNNHLKLPNSSQDHNSPRLNQDTLLWISIQIASGMTYLSSQRFVHRDLACRNCLVGFGLVVKIADFGMSRDIYTCDYYKTGGLRKLPIRWMSPESLVYGRFTLESDIWSYGVVLWEIYSYGAQPYYGHTNEGVRELLLQGILLQPPFDCPCCIVEIMGECWKRDPKDRIKFLDVMNLLEIAQTKRTTLPRPPQGPVTIRAPNILDPDGYLLPSPTIHREYFQPLPS